MEFLSINHFQNPWLLLLLPLPFALLFWHLYRSKRQPAVVYSDLSIARDIAPSIRQRVLKMLPFVRTVALCLGIVALARPQYGTVVYNQESLGVDIALSIDVSGSMRQKDYYPNRLEAAKRAAISFVDNRETDRISVIIFGVEAALLCPPTLDMEVVKMFIEAIQDGMINNQATAVGDGLAMALRKLEDSDAASRVVILLTDGESNSGEIQPLQAAEIAEALAVRVYTIGVGSRSMFRGMTAPGFDEGTLQEIADLTGGRYFSATNEKQLEEIYMEIDRLEKSKIEVEESANYDERFMYFWFPGLILLAMEFLMRAFWLRRLP